MSSAETPPDPGDPAPTAEKIRTAVRRWLIMTGVLCLLAMIVIVCGEATRKIPLF
jgi:hypothetical protein